MRVIQRNRHFHGRLAGLMYDRQNSRNPRFPSGNGPSDASLDKVIHYCVQMPKPRHVGQRWHRLI
jgi:hypothetical protein